MSYDQIAADAISQLAAKNAEIAALRGALKLAREDIIQTMETFGDDEPETDKTIIAIDAALEMSGGAL